MSETTTIQDGEVRVDGDRRYVVISADCHAGPREPRDYRPYMEQRHHKQLEEAAEQQRAMRRMLLGIQDADDGDEADPFRAGLRASLRALGVDDALVEEQLTRHYTSVEFVAGAWDPQRRLADLEADGIVGEVVYPDGVFGTSPPFAFSGDGELRAAGCRAYNRWLADLCAAHPGRRAGVALVDLHDIDAALHDIRWAREAGLTGGIALPVMTVESGLPGYNDRRYEPVWSLCEEMEVPVNHHGGARAADAALYGRDPTESFSLNTFETGFLSRRPFWFLLVGGVLERHPCLKLVLTENMADWVPSMLHEMDYLTEQFWMSGLRARLSMKPSEYWARQCYVGASFMSRHEAELREQIGVGNVMWGSDFPHVEGTRPYTAESLRNTFGGLPEAEVRRIVGENAAAVYRFDLTRLQAIADRLGPPVDAVAAGLGAAGPPRDYIGSGFRS